MQEKFWAKGAWVEGRNWVVGRHARRHARLRRDWGWNTPIQASVPMLGRPDSGHTELRNPQERLPVLQSCAGFNTGPPALLFQRTIGLCSEFIHEAKLALQQIP